MELSKKQMGIIIIVLLIGIISLIIYGFIRNRKQISLEKEYKEIILKSDTLRMIGDGKYQKLVNDLHSYKELNTIIKEENKSLYTQLLKENKKPILYTNLGIKPKGKKDTVIIKKDKGIDTFIDYYPDIKSKFITYTGKIEGERVIGNWEFEPMKLDIVISERKKGLYEADLHAPEWLTVSTLKVNALPLTTNKNKKTEWLIGVNAGYGIKEKNTIGGFEIGMKRNNRMFTTGINTNKEVKIGYHIVL